MWYQRLNIRTTREGEISARVCAGRESPWFAGHFPGDPILPGIAQLAMVADCITDTTDRPMHMAGVSRVKFRKIVRPGELLDIHCAYGNKRDHYSFRITSGGEDVCSGMMRFTPKK